MSTLVSLGSTQAINGYAPIAIVGEDVEGPLDEAYLAFTRRIARALANRTRIIEVSVPRGRARPPWALVHAARRAQAAGAGTLIYVSRSSYTVPALLRARLLRLAAPGATHVFVGLQPRPLPRFRRTLAGRVWPDLLLVGTTGERDRLRRLGARTEVIAGGVDLDRFRPPVDAAERSRIRARWALPPDVKLILHVGHATRGRNLEALTALTGLVDMRVLAVLSSRDEPAAAPVVEDLRRRGAIVRQGYLQHVEELYRASDCYVMPTPSTDRVVAFPLSVLEALASGLPVVTRPVGALPGTLRRRARGALLHHHGRPAGSGPGTAGGRAADPPPGVALHLAGPGGRDPGPAALPAGAAGMIAAASAGTVTSRSELETANLLNDIPRLRELLRASINGCQCLDAYLFAAGIQQILDDALHPDVLRLRQTATALRRRRGRRGRGLVAAADVTDAAAVAVWSAGPGLLPPARLLEARDAVGGLVGRLAGAVMGLQGLEDASTDLDRVDALLRRLPASVLRHPLRLPACFRTFDQTPRDLWRLAEMVIERWPRTPLLVVGVRTSGSYLAPLLTAALQRLGGSPAAVLTLRPGQRWLRGESAVLREIVAAAGVGLVIDDPPRSWASVARAAQELRRAGLPAERVALVLPTLPSTAPLPDRLAPHPTILLPWPRWEVHERLSPAAVAKALQRLVGPSEAIKAVVRLPLEADAAGDRGHARALYGVGIEVDRTRESRLVYAKGVGLGYLGRQACAVARPLAPFLPRVYGVDGGILYREWLPERERQTAAGVTAEAADRIAEYVDRRAAALSVEHDPTFDLGARGSAPGEAALLLSRAAGRGDLLLRPLTERLVRRLLRAGRPAVLDGHVAPDAWFGAPEAPASLRKIGFDERAFSSLDLTCFDPVFDLADAACDGQPRGFEDRLRAAYAERSGDIVDAERWLLYRLVHLQDRLRHSGAPRWTLERLMSRCLLRYLEERVVGTVEPSPAGPLCAFDIDGVLESVRLGFSSSTPGAANALRSLTCHGYRPVLVSGRSLAEVRDRCDAYHLPGGVAEYGAALYVRGDARDRVLIGAEELAALERVRDRLKGTPGVAIDPAYCYSVRAYAPGSAGTRAALPPQVVAEAIEFGGAGGVREVRGRLQTDFVAAGAGKGAGLRALAGTLGSEGARPVLVMGDTQSDLGMLRLAERALAPANADQTLREEGVTILRQACQGAVVEGVGRLLGHAPGGCPCCRGLPPEPRADLLLRTLEMVEGGGARNVWRLLQLSARLSRFA